MKKSDAKLKLKRLQTNFYEVLYEITKSNSIGGGVIDIALLYSDLCKLKTELDEIIKEIEGLK